MSRTRRPDLEALEYTKPGLLTGKIFPMIPRAKQIGTLYYQDLQSATTAEDDRTAGTAPSSNLLADAKVSFDLEADELIDRQEIPDSEIDGLGGLDAAQQVAARRGKRSVGNAIEGLTVANVLGSDDVSYTDIGSSLITACNDGFDDLADRAGQGDIVLVISSKLFSLVKKYDEVVERMKMTGVLPASVRDVRGISRQQLAAALGVDDVLVGNNTQWYSEDAAYQDRAALVKIPNPALDPIEDAQVGRTVWYSTTGVDPAEEDLFEIHTWFSNSQLSEMVDVRAYAEQKQLNSELIYGLDGLDGALWTS